MPGAVFNLAAPIPPHVNITTHGLPTPKPGSSPAELIIASKHAEYSRAANLYRTLYYSTRVLAGLSAGLLPFVVSAHPDYALALSIVVVVCTVIDLVFGVKDRWMLMSKAADLLAVERLRLSGNYDKYKDALAVLTMTESAKFDRLPDLDTVLKKVRDVAPR